MIYFVQHVKTGLVKIGKARDVKQRLWSLHTLYGDVALIGMIEGYTTKEKELHKLFSHANNRLILQGVEWFNPIPEILALAAANPPKQMKTIYKKKPVVKRETRQVRVSDSVGLLIEHLTETNPNLKFADVLEDWANRLYPETYEAIVKGHKRVNELLSTHQLDKSA